MLEPLWATETTPKEAKAAGWKRVGETEDGRPIWEESVVTVVDKVPLVVGGVQQYVKAGGEIVKEKLRNVTESVSRRFVEEKLPNGGKFKNYDFEPDPAEKARIEKRRRVLEVQSSLAEKLVERGLSVDALLDAVAGGSDEEPTPKRGRRPQAD